VVSVLSEPSLSSISPLSLEVTRFSTVPSSIQGWMPEALKYYKPAKSATTTKTVKTLKISSKKTSTKKSSKKK